MLSLLALILVGALIGIGSLCISLVLLLNKKFEGELAELLHRDLLTEENLSDFVEELDLEKELSPLVSDKMDQLTQIFTQRFPMLGMFLTPEMAAPFKKTGQEEILRILPELTSKLTKRAASREVAERLSQKLDGKLRRSPLFKKLFVKMLLIGALTGATVGLLVGVLSLFLLGD